MLSQVPSKGLGWHSSTLACTSHWPHRHIGIALPVLLSAIASPGTCVDSSRSFQLSSIVSPQYVLYIAPLSLRPKQSIDWTNRVFIDNITTNAMTIVSVVRGRLPLQASFIHLSRICYPIILLRLRLITIEQDTLCQRSSMSLMRISLLRVPDLVEAKTAERQATMITTEFSLGE